MGRAIILKIRDAEETAAAVGAKRVRNRVPITASAKNAPAAVGTKSKTSAGDVVGEFKVDRPQCGWCGRQRIES